MARISVFGGTGYTGAHIVAEAVQRGHAVTSISRNAQAERLDGSVLPGITALAADAERAGVPIGVIGGAGSLQVAEGGPRLFDTAAFPAEYRPESLEMAAALDDLRAAPESLDWFYLCPPAGFGGFAPGEVRGTYRVGGNVLLADEEDNSFIGGADFATAVVDEIERPSHRRARFTVAY